MRLFSNIVSARTRHGAVVLVLVLVSSSRTRTMEGEEDDEENDEEKEETLCHYCLCGEMRTKLETV